MAKCKKPVKAAFGGMLSSMGSMFGGLRRPVARPGSQAMGQVWNRPASFAQPKPAMAPQPMLGGGSIAGAMGAAQPMLGASGLGLMAKTRMGMMAKGGKVKGKAKVAGDSKKNDVVPALLSPGEIVVPRSKAKSKQAAQKFVSKVVDNAKRRRGK